MKLKKFRWIFGLGTAVLAGTAGWAFYNLINMGIEDMLYSFGVTNPYYQAATVFGVIIALFVLIGFGFKKSVERIIR